jgi:hypothetical protein
MYAQRKQANARSYSTYDKSNPSRPHDAFCSVTVVRYAVADSRGKIETG